MCSRRRYGSIDMQHDLFRSGHDLGLDLRSNIQNVLLRSNYSSFGASWQEKHDAGKMNVVPLLSKKRVSQKWLFLECLLSGGQTVDLSSNMRTFQRESVKRAVECVFPWRCSSSGSRVICQFVEKCWNRQNLTFRDLWWPDPWPDLKNDWSSFFMTLTLFRIPLTACRYMAQEPS